MQGAQLPLQVKVWTRFNPSLRSALFFVPGLTAYLLAIMCIPTPSQARQLDVLSLNLRVRVDDASLREPVWTSSQSSP